MLNDAANQDAKRSSVLQPEAERTLIFAEQYNAILSLQKSIFELVALKYDDEAVLKKLCELEESLLPNSVASIMILDEEQQHLDVLSAPSMSAEGIAQLNGLKPGPNAGSCGNAVYNGEPVYINDALADPRCHDLQHVVQNFNFCACWSIPVRTYSNKVIGTFALFSFERRSPDLFHERLLEMGAFVVSIVIKRRAQESLLAKHNQRLKRASAAFANAGNGVLITDKNNHIIEMNAAVEKMFGYAANEVLDKNPSIFSAGRQDKRFYQHMWETLEEELHWSGEIWNQHKLGEPLLLWVSISVIRDKAGKIKNYLAIYTDLSELRLSQEKLTFMAYHDTLTGLSNRAYLFDHLENSIEQSSRDNSQMALLFLDLDRFKSLNDTYGHIVGDKILIQVANRLKKTLRNENNIVRLGGDEFVVLLDKVQDISEVYQLAEEILNQLQQPFHYDSSEFLLSGSIGIVMYPQDGDSAETLLKNADTAMYRAKALGGAHISFYSPDLSKMAQRMSTLELELHQALKNQEFELYYQPKIDAHSGHIQGLEALIRWQHPLKGMLNPTDFISMAEQTGLIIPIGEWVLDTACAYLQELHQVGYKFSIAVNLSEQQFNPEGIGCILNFVNTMKLPSEWLELELTETFLMQNAEMACQMLEQLHEAGIRLTIDDFGSGSFSLTDLKRFKAHCLKIDQSLVQDIGRDPNDFTMRAVMALGHSLDLKVVAKGVETQLQKQVLQENGCDSLQGYLLAKPMSVAELNAFLQLKHPNGA